MKHRRNISIFIASILLAVPGGILFSMQASTTDPAAIIKKLQDQNTYLVNQLLRAQQSQLEFKYKKIFDHRLAKGAFGEDISELQNFLVGHGYISTTTVMSKGYFGPITKEAVKKFQLDNGLEPVGIVGPKTRSLIVSSLVKEAQPVFKIDSTVSLDLVEASSTANTTDQSDLSATSTDPEPVVLDIPIDPAPVIIAVSTSTPPTVKATTTPATSTSTPKVAPTPTTVAPKPAPGPATTTTPIAPKISHH